MFEFFSKKKSNDVEHKVETQRLVKKNISWIEKLKAKLNLSSSVFKNIFSLFASKHVNYDKLEELLLEADIDFELTTVLIQKIKDSNDIDVTDPLAIRALIKRFMLDIFKENNKQFCLKKDSDTKKIILFCGINGGGKTTTIAKIASLYKEYFKVLLVGCDSFRAAANEQLSFWANSANVEFFDKNLSRSNDPASIAHSAVEYSKEHNNDLLLIDTSGRLTNDANLMLELQKIERVLCKINPKYPQETILVLDGTMGQNLHSQVEKFSKFVKITGLIITKLDGVSRGGIVVSLAYKFKIPIYFICIGEGQDDINYFNPEDFLNSLLGIN